MIPKKSNHARPINILFVLEHFYPYIGGAEKLFYVLTTSLAKDNFEITVVTTQFDQNLPKEEIHKGVKIIRVNCFNRYAFTLFSLPKVFHYARNSDLIHTTTYNAALPAVLIGKLLKKPVYVTFHEVWGALWRELPFTSFFQKNTFYFFEKMLLKLPFHKFIAVSEFTKSELIKSNISSAKIERIYNGIDYQLFKDYSPTPPETFTFTYFGRLGISKGLDLLIPATAEFKKSFPNSKLKLIIPKYPKVFFQKIMDLIKNYDLENYIELHHNLPREELYNQLLSSTCIVIPSYSEGFCFAAAETVALGIPIISSNQGALKETVSGSFILLENMTVSALACALKKAHQQNWTKIPVQNFHLSDSVAAYKRLYSFKGFGK